MVSSLFMFLFVLFVCMCPGHPFDTIKVRIQTSAPSAIPQTFSATLKEFGGAASLFRGMVAPLSAAAVINAIVFGSYGVASRFYDEHLIQMLSSNNNSNDVDNSPNLSHDPWPKAMACGSFAGEC
jgi:hypothetical protein